MDPKRLQSSPYVTGELTLTVPLAPAHLSLGDSAAQQVFSEMLIRYHSEIGGTLLAFAKARFSDDQTFSDSHFGGPIGRIVEFLPVIHARITADVLLFRPRLGTILSARVNSVGDSFVGCLIAGLFNATLLKDDLAGGYSFDELSRAWVATEAHADAGRAARAEAEAESAGAGTASKKRKRAEAGAGAGSSYNRLLACNPSRLSEGDTLFFRLVGTSHTLSGGGLFTLQGTLMDDHIAPTRAVGGEAIAKERSSAPPTAFRVSIRAPMAPNRATAGDAEGEGEEEEVGAQAPHKKDRKEKNHGKDRREEDG